MLSIKGTFKDGVAHPAEPLQGYEGQPVIITFLEESVVSFTDETAWDALTQLLKACSVETGITDLAHQHDHYLYGKPKDK